MNFYVLPTEEGLPPRAVLFEGDMPELTEAGAVMIAGTLATWSADMGTWTVGGMPLSTDLSEQLTQRAKSLGVEW